MLSISLEVVVPFLFLGGALTKWTEHCRVDSRGFSVRLLERQLLGFTILIYKGEGSLQTRSIIV
jgi:hypothetical protein